MLHIGLDGQTDFLNRNSIGRHGLIFFVIFFWEVIFTKMKAQIAGIVMSFRIYKVFVEI